MDYNMKNVDYIINKIETYQKQNDNDWENMIKLPFDEMLVMSAQIIGKMEYQLKAIKIELEILKTK